MSQHLTPIATHERPALPMTGGNGQFIPIHNVYRCQFCTRRYYLAVDEMTGTRYQVLRDHRGGFEIEGKHYLHHCCMACVPKYCSHLMGEHERFPARPGVHHAGGLKARWA